MSKTEDLGYAEEVSSTVNKKKTSTSKPVTRSRKKTTSVDEAIEIDKANKVAEEKAKNQSVIVAIDEAGIVDLNTITPEKLELLKERSKSITEQSLLNLGATAQAKMSASADKYLHKVRSSDMSELGDTLQSMRNEFTRLDIDKLQPMSPFKKFIYSLPGMRSLRYNTKTFLSKLDDISGNLDGISKSLREGQVEAMKDNTSLEIMRDETEQTILELQDDLAVGAIKRNELLSEIEMMKATPESYDAHDIADAQQFLVNIERRCADINVTMVSMIMSLNDTRIMKQGNDIIIQKITSAIQNALPIWKQTMARGVMLTKQASTIEKIDALADYTNEMLIKNSEMMMHNATAIARANERAPIDYETLVTCRDNTLKLLKELEEIQTNGSIERENLQKNLKEMVIDMNQSLLGVNETKTSKSGVKKIKK